MTTRRERQIHWASAEYNVSFVTDYRSRIALAGTLTRLARRCLAEFRIYPTLIEEKLFPAHCGPDEVLILCRREEQLLGVATVDLHVVSGRKIGGVRVLLVDPVFRGRGVGTAILAAIEAWLLARNVDRIWLYCSIPNYLYPGARSGDLSIKSFARKIGYDALFTTRDMGVDLPTLRPQPAPRDVAVRSVGSQIYSDELCAFTKKHFPTFHPEVEIALGRQHPIAFSAYDGSLLVGFCVAGANNQPLGAIGPAAVLPEYRGRKVFQSVLYECMRALRERGHTFARMQWADTRAGPFYNRWFDGFVCEEFVVYGKRFQCRQ